MNILATIRNILATLYPDEASIRRVVDDSGINSAQIAFNTNALNTWHFVIEEAKKNNQIEALLCVAESEYKTNDALLNACRVYRQKPGITNNEPLKILGLFQLINSIKVFSNRQLNQPHHPGYMLWLGAGASASSKVPTAPNIVKDLLKKAYELHSLKSVSKTHIMSDDEIRQWAIKNLHWFGPDFTGKSEYAQVLENFFPAPGPRKEYLRMKMRNTRPASGYRYLGLLLRENIFDTVITTNFDHLIRQAADPFLPQPLIEINAPAQYKNLQPFPDDPQLIRLHGDFWHGNLLNSEKELKSTPKIRYGAVKKLLHTYGLIVIGYGGWDVKIMQGIFEALKSDPDAFKNGLFWCYPKGTQLSPFVMDFLRDAPRDRIHLVEIVDFDQTMRDLAIAFGVDFGVDDLSEQDLASRYKVTWEGMALLIQLIEELYTLTSSIVSLPLHLQRLITLLMIPHALLVYKGSQADRWQMTSANGNSIIPSQVEFTNE